MRLKLTLAYDGTGFCGWARQPGGRSVEAVLADALASVYRATGAIAVAGRTDAGVHAVANVASLDVSGGPPPDRAARALNAVLPADLVVVAAEPVAEEFHARFSARSRSYLYRVRDTSTRSPFERQRALWHPAPLDHERLEECAARLVGEHDFRAFTPTDTQHQVFVRTVVRACWRRREGTLDFEITADSFLRHMVRTLVGTMLERERGPEALAALLRGVDRSEAGRNGASLGALSRCCRLRRSPAGVRE